jgi:hypothetical protein
MDNAEGNREDGRWLSYTELARVRGISKESAIRLVRRERWRKLPGNDAGGTVRVLVPEDWLKPVREDVAHSNPILIREGIPEDLRQLTAGWEQAIVLSRIRAEAAEARADAAEADRRVAEGRAESERARADRADEDRRATEGRAERIEQDRDRANALVANLEADLQAKDAEIARAQSAASEQRSAAEQARVEAQTAQEQAEELRRADEARKARGRWTRLRAAWRGN